MTISTIPVWRSRAACLGDTGAMFPERAGYPTDYRPALAICAACPVKSPCLRTALDAGERYGVWGGYTPEERQRMPQRRWAA